MEKNRHTKPSIFCILGILLLAVTAFSVPVFHERLTKRQGLGVAMILAALVLLNI